MLPYNDYFEYYGPDYRLHMPTSNMENMNKKETLEEVRLSAALSKVLTYVFSICVQVRGMWQESGQGCEKKVRNTTILGLLPSGSEDTLHPNARILRCGGAPMQRLE